MTLALELFSQLAQTNDILREAVMGSGGRANPPYTSSGGGGGGGVKSNHHNTVSTTSSTTGGGMSNDNDDKSDLEGAEESSHHHHQNTGSDAELAIAEDAAMEDIHGEGRIQRVPPPYSLNTYFPFFLFFIPPNS